MKHLLLLLLIFLLTCANEQQQKEKQEIGLKSNNTDQKFVNKNFNYSEDLALVSIQSNNKYPLQISSSLLFGYIDKNKNIVIPCKYSEASDFINGLALVKEKNYQYIDKKGNVVKYLFNNNLKLNQNNWYKKNDTLFVIKESGIPLKKDADLNSDNLTNIKFADELIIIELPDNNKTLKYDDLSGYWVQVEYQGYKGFVYDAYLSPYKPPKLGNENIFQYIRNEKIIDKRELNALHLVGGPTIKLLSNDVIYFEENIGTSTRVILSFSKFNFQQGFLFAKFLLPNELKDEKLPTEQIFKKTIKNDGATKEITISFDKNNYFIIEYYDYI